MRAVSYTHLDVYKRQSLDSVNSRRAKSPTSGRATSSPTAVSYTHLDVYKRQEYNKAVGLNQQLMAVRTQGLQGMLQGVEGLARCV